MSLIFPVALNGQNVCCLRLDRKLGNLAIGKWMHCRYRVQTTEHALNRLYIRMRSTTKGIHKILRLFVKLLTFCQNLMEAGCLFHLGAS